MFYFLLGVAFGIVGGWYARGSCPLVADDPHDEADARKRLEELRRWARRERCRNGEEAD